MTLKIDNCKWYSLEEYFIEYFTPEHMHVLLAQWLVLADKKAPLKSLSNPFVCLTLDSLSFDAKICSSICQEVLQVYSLTFQMVDQKFLKVRKILFPCITAAIS